MKAAIYARYSSDSQREESISAQIRAIEEYSVRNQILIVKKYIDEAKSAVTNNRPQFLQLMEDIEHHQFDALIVHKLDRFARNRYDSAYYKKLLCSHGIRLISVTENLDDSPESVIMESVLEGMAEYYSKNLSREVKKGQRETALQCKFTGGTPPLGYVINANNEYEINTFEAEIVRTIFSMYNTGSSYSDIINYLNSQNYKTKFGKAFKKTSINAILQNEKYGGIYMYRKTVRVRTENGERHEKQDPSQTITIDGEFPGIVSSDEFDNAQNRLTDNKKRNRSSRAKEIYLLSSKLYCGQCGRKMMGTRRKARDKYYVRYRCPGQNDKTCDQKELHADLIEAEVVNRLEKMFDSEDVEKMAENVYNEFIDIMAEAQASLGGLEEDLKKTKHEIDNIVKAVTAGLFHTSMIEKMDALELRRADLEERIV